MASLHQPEKPARFIAGAFLLRVPYLSCLKGEPHVRYLQS